MECETIALTFFLACIMSNSLDQVPAEIISSIVSHLDDTSLCVTARTALSLQPHAERLLYLKVDLTDTVAPSAQNMRDRTKTFLRTITENFRGLGCHTISLGAHYFGDYKLHEYLPQGLEGPTTPRYTNPYAYAFIRMPNLTAIKLLWIDTSLSNVLVPYDDPSRTKLNHFCVNFRDISEEDMRKTSGYLFQYLKDQPHLHCLSLFFPNDVWVSPPGIAGPILPEYSVDTVAAGLCHSLEVLEGNDMVVRLLFPGRRVKKLLWRCHFTTGEIEDFRPPASLNAYPTFCNPYFTPEMCEAYGRLEHLAIFDRLSLFPLLSPFLTSLTSLLIHEYPERIGRQPIWDDSRFLEALGNIAKLETLVVTPGADVSEFWEWPDDREPEEEQIFNVCHSLKSLVFLKFGHFEVWAGGMVYLPFAYEREGGVGGNIVMSRKRQALDKVLDIPYLLRGWSTFDVDSEVLKYLRPQ